MQNQSRDGKLKVEFDLLNLVLKDTSKTEMGSNNQSMGGKLNVEFGTQLT